jgi:PPOX class probable F420-dependent enzyme
VAPAANLDELPGWGQNLLAEARVGHLGAVDGHGRPRVLPVTFAVADGAVWSAVDHKPKVASPDQIARVRWLRQRPASSLTVDSYDEDWERLAWVQVVGATAVLEAADQPRAVDALVSRYPQYRDRPPAGPLLRLAPDRIVYWCAAGSPEG